MKTLYETARDSLIVIESISSGSTTTNSLPHLARLAREGLTAIESADRAQQGEPVGCEAKLKIANRCILRLAHEIEDLRAATKAAAPVCPTCKGNDQDAPCAYPSQGKPGCLRDARLAAAPADAPYEVQIGEGFFAGCKVTVDPSLLADTIEMRGANRVRANIRTGEVYEVAAQAPDTGIPTAGEVASTIVQDVVDLFAASGFEVRPDNSQFAIVGSLDAAGVLVNAVIEHFQAGAERFDWSRKGMVLDPQGFYVHYSRSDDLNLSGRAPVSTTPTSGAVEKAGWKWVPETITEDMHVAAVRAAIRATGNDDFPPAVWAAMLAAAPSLPSEAKAGEDA